MAFYTDVDRLLTILPAIQSKSGVTSADMVSFIERVDAEINAEVGRRYTTPSSDGLATLTPIATDITLYQILAQRLFTQQQQNESEWPSVFKEARQRLKRIGDGEIPLVDSSGNVVTADRVSGESPVWSNTMDYKPMFDEREVTLWRQDPDKIDDLDDQDD